MHANQSDIVPAPLGFQVLGFPILVIQVLAKTNGLPYAPGGVECVTLGEGVKKAKSIPEKSTLCA